MVGQHGSLNVIALVLAVRSAEGDTDIGLI